MISHLLPERAATIQQLGHPGAGIIGFTDAGGNTAGEHVTPDVALNYSAVWAATRVIAETVASLPCILYRRTGDGKERAREDERFGLIHDQPNDEQSSYTWFETQTAHAVNHGNAYSKIERRGNDPLQLLIRTPDVVDPERDDDGMLIYKISDTTEETIEWPDMLHTLGLSSSDGLIGDSVIRRARQAIGTAIAQDKYKGSFFGNGAVPRGAVEHPARMDKAAREQFRREWDQVHGGAGNANKIGIFHGGMKWIDMGMSHEDAQFLESQQFSVQEIARWYRLPPHLLGDLTRASFSNIEQQSLEFVVYSLTPWLRRWESSLNMKLLRRGERAQLFYEFLVDALLRGDIESRYNAYATARQWGWLSVNEIRSKENDNPIGDEGDVYLQPMNMAPAGEPPPETISTEFQSNLATTLDEIRCKAADMAAGLSDLSTADADLAHRLSGLRDERNQIRADLEKIGQTVQVALSRHVERARNLAKEQCDKALRSLIERENRKAEKLAAAAVNNGVNFVAEITAYFDSWREQCEHVLSGPVGVLAALQQQDAAEQLTVLIDGHLELALESFVSAADVQLEGLQKSVAKVCEKRGA